MGMGEHAGRSYARLQDTQKLIIELEEEEGAEDALRASATAPVKALIWKSKPAFSRPGQPDIRFAVMSFRFTDASRGGRHACQVGVRHSPLSHCSAIV